MTKFGSGSAQVENPDFDEFLAGQFSAAVQDLEPPDITTFLRALVGTSVRVGEKLYSSDRCFRVRDVLRGEGGPWLVLEGTRSVSSGGFERREAPEMILLNVAKLSEIGFNPEERPEAVKLLCNPEPEEPLEEEDEDY